MKFLKSFLFLLVFGLFFASNTNAQTEAMLMMYPNTSDTEITFIYGGDVFVVPLNGGLARRITTSLGIEQFPRFSPNGKTIAFIGNYDGNADIYTVPNYGGQPFRVTYGVDLPNLPDRMGPDKIIMQWTKDGKKILYRGRQDTWNSLVGNLYTVASDGSMPEMLPLPKGGFASFSPDETKLAYNRIFREFRTWKRYSGGQADDIWIYDFKTNKIENITNNPAQDIIPMWAGNKIYFLSDRDRVMNLFVYDLSSKQTKKVTNFTDYDVKFPSLGAKHISFTAGGAVYLVDLANDQVSKVPIMISEDFASSRPEIEPVKNFIAGSEISPKGNAGLFAARGDLFIVPAEKGNVINITKSVGVHDRNPRWSPDGEWIAFISDKSGEDEVYIIKPDGSGLTQLTNDAKSYRFELDWSPDSKYLLNSDKEMNLYLIDVSAKKSKTIAHSKVWEIRSFGFSPDSKWITYVDAGDNQFNQIHLYNIADGKTHKITSEFYNSSQPTWDPDGKYLFFVSSRHFQGKVGEFEYNYLFEDMENIYGLVLNNTDQNPLAKYESDLMISPDKKVEKSDKKAKDKDAKDKSAEVDNSIKIDLDGLQDRLFEIPTPNGGYYGLNVFNGKIYYARYSSSTTPSFYSFDLKEKKEEQVGDFSRFAISNDGKKILVAKDGNYYIADLGKKVDLKGGKLNIENMEMYLDKKEEWTQIFNEAWRQMKYFLYDPNMHGVDWKAIKEKYAKLLPYVNTRFDLTFLIGEMIGELDIGHAYVGGGDMPKLPVVKIGLLGARYSLDNSGFYKIEKIFEGRNWDPKTYSPLTEPGLNVKVGDYIIAIDDEPLSKLNHPNKALNNKVNQYVKLTVNSKPSKDGAHDIWVKTIGNEENLIYLNWVENNRRYVEKATNGRIGYIHIPDMGFDNGLLEFVKYFYPQLNKEGLIIDDRYNGGGNVSPLVIERLRREFGVAEHARNQEIITGTPTATMPGPLVCLINQQSMSDGDLFPYQFKKYNLGKLIGKRSWGGVIGIRGSLPFTDGSYMTKPEFANFGTDGTWILEDVGMIPDIEIENDPHKEWIGVDEQLDKAIEVILQDIKTNKKQQLPKTTPPYPKK